MHLYRVQECLFFENERLNWLLETRSVKKLYNLVDKTNLDTLSLVSRHLASVAITS